MKLSEILNENIEKKWPYIQKVLLSTNVGTLAPGLIADFRHHDIRAHQYLDQYVKSYLIQADPVARRTNGRKTPFVNHIVRWLLNGNLVFPEDIETTYELLVQYQRAKHNYGHEVPELDTIRNPAELRKLIMDFGEYSGFDAIADKIVGTQGPFTAYRIDSWEEGQPLFCDSGWCIKEKSYFEHYGPPFYLITRKKGHGQKREALLHIGEGQLMDVYDNHLEFDHVEELTPILDDIYANFLADANEHGASKTDNFLSPVFHVLDEMPKTLNLLDQMAIVNSTHMRSITDLRWPANIEKRIMEHPKALISYMLIMLGEIFRLVAIDDVEGLDHYDMTEMENEMLVHLGKLFTEKDNTPYELSVDDDGKRIDILMLAMIYYGKTLDLSDEWNRLKDLVRWIGSRSFENRMFIIDRCLRYTKEHGYSKPMVAAMYNIFPDWIKERHHILYTADVQGVL